MERFQKIDQRVTRCTYSPTDTISNASRFIFPEKMEGTPVSTCPLPVQSVSFQPRDIYISEPDGEPQVRIMKTVDGQRSYISNLKERFSRRAWRAELSLRFDPQEHIFGLGQDEDGVWDKRGQVSYLYQHNMKIPVPMFVSSLGYGVLFNCACLMVFDDRAEVCRITLECVDQLDFFVITGTMDEIIASYRELTGRASPLPRWAYGYWQSRERYRDQEELVQTALRYRELDIPLDVIVQDWKTWEGELWGDKHLDPERYPNIAQANKTLHEALIHSIVSVWPNMNMGGRDHQEFAKKGMLLNDYSTYNAFDPEARKLYWEQANRELYSGGFDGWWCDSTEPFAAPDWGGEVKLPEEERYQLVGREHEKHLDPQDANIYALEHAKGIFENQPNKPVVNLTRSGWAGIQKYGAILWAGDTSATWEELRREIAKGMSISISGIPYWTVDAGAFFVGGQSCWRKWKEDPNADPVWFWHGDYDLGVEDKGYQELYTRWLQFACFLPIFRSHGTDTPREVWNFDEPFRSAITDAIRLRYKLMPYITDMADQVVSGHFTMMRSLVFDFPQDPHSALADDAFMFGRDVLVYPVTEPILYRAGNVPVEDVSPEKRCYLPQGTDWVDYWTGTEHPGGQTVSVPVTIDHIPLFIRKGSSLLP